MSPFYPGLKFSVRDLLLVTVIVALVLGWWVDRSKLTGEVEHLKEREVVAEMMRLSNLPTSQAPAPNPPKDCIASINYSLRSLPCGA